MLCAMCGVWRVVWCGVLYELRGVRLWHVCCDVCSLSQAVQTVPEA